MSAPRYHPFYCEENIWWLCAAPPPGIEIAKVAFIASISGACPIAQQRAAGDDGLAWWDYHCIALDATGRVWDLDSRLGVPVARSDWLAMSFPFGSRLAPVLRPWFRVVSSADYRAQFASDRRHMRTPEGGWLHPPPPWPCIGVGSNLDQFRNLSADAGPGRLLDLGAFAALG